jgi:RIO kinase 1
MPQACRLRLLIHQRPRARSISVVFLLLSQSMDTLSNYYDELDDEGHFEEAPHPKTNKPKLAPQTVAQFVQRQDEDCKTFSFTYKPARFEEGWLLDSLGYFFEQRWISDVLSKIKAGKEASVYLCRSGSQVESALVAAKVFRPRMLRNLKNDQLYRLDRDVLDENGHRVHDLGMLKAQHKRSVYGEQIRHKSWIAYEFQTLKTLYAAGADVPRPYEMSENAILMGYIGNELSAAPTLNTVTLDTGEARLIYSSLLNNIEIMLEHGIVHGDLSAYNVLYWDGNITVIDFPQVVSPSGHRSAYQIFRRDIQRVCDYFARQSLQTDPARLAASLWKAHGYRLHPELHPGMLDANDPASRTYWQKKREQD